MTTETFNTLQVGDEVIVRKSGKTYSVNCVWEPMTDAEWAANEERRAAAARNEWVYVAVYAERRTERKVYFHQIRANSKGVVGRYGPVVALKPANIDLATGEVR